MPTTPPDASIVIPSGDPLQDGVTFRAQASDFCGAACTGNPPIPCYDGTDFVCDQAEQLPPLGDVDLVCNEGYTLEMACQEYVGMLPPPAQEHIPDVCANIPVGDIGTCQAPGEAGFPCAEDADCVNTCDVDAGVCL